MSFLDNLNLEQIQKGASEGEPSWLAHLRSEAASRLLDEGMPTKKTESWRFTSLTELLKQPFKSHGKNSQNRECQGWAEEYLGDDDCNRLFLVNGRPIGFGKAPENLEIHRLAQLLADQPEAIQPYLARSARSEFFGALNSALFEDGLAIHVHRNAVHDTPLHIVHISAPEEEASASYPRIALVVDENAEFQLIETYLSRPGQKSLTTAVTEVYLEANAKLDHTRVVLGNDASYHVGHLSVRQGRDSRYRSQSVVMGSKLCRVDIDASMTQPGAECVLDGMYHGVENEHVDHNTTIVHGATHCSSSEEYRGLVDGRAHAVWDGTIVVERGAQHTSAHQQNHNLLLSDTATVNTKPHLEIDTDDLSASHGATVGALDPDQLFFLRARGIDEAQARAMLTFSFVRSILDRVKNESVRKRLVAELIERMPEGESIEELAL